MGDFAAIQSIKLAHRAPIASTICEHRRSLRQVGGPHIWPSSLESLSNAAPMLKTMGPNRA
jgi:hypothetical protein